MHGSLSLTATDADPAAAIGHSASDPDAELVERARVDREAFGELYQRYYPLVATYVQRRTGDRVATEELVSDVFFAVLAGLHRFRWRRLPFRNWVLRIATNSVRRRARAASRRDALHRRSERNAPEHEEPRHSAADRVHAALLELPVRFQEALVLHYVEGLSVREVAAVVGCREGTVKSRLARGRDALRTRLAAREDPRSEL